MLLSLTVHIPAAGLLPHQVNVNETFRILCNFQSHYLQRKIHSIIQMLISPQRLKKEISSCKGHIWKLLLLCPEQNCWGTGLPAFNITKQLWLSRFFPVQLSQSTIKIAGQGHSSLDLLVSGAWVLNYRLPSYLLCWQPRNNIQSSASMKFRYGPFDTLYRKR